MQDLWADCTGITISTEERRRGRGTRQRRLTEHAVLTDVRAWLLQEYLLPYATLLGTTRIFRRCYWIDALGTTRTATQEPARKAISSQRGTSKKGQRAALPPALQPVATIAHQLAQLARPITLQGLVLDQHLNKRHTPHATTQRADNGTREPGPTQPARLASEMLTTLPAEGGVLSATWAELAPALLAKLEQSAAIFLLDPLKDGLLRYTDLAPLYQRTAPTELFLWFSHKQIETRLLPSLSTSEGATALTQLLRGDRWKSLLSGKREATSAQPLIDGLIHLCAESMRPHFLSVQCLAFPILNGPASVTHAPYTLLFATRRQDSLASLNDACCQRTRRLVVESQQGVLNEQWFAQQRAEQLASAWEALASEVLDVGRTQRMRRWPDLRQQLLLTHFGQYTLHEYDQIITTLLARGDVRCEWQKRSQETPETLLPGPGDLLLWR